ncbi:MAG: HepT-like ribonuclease domain-containing protein [bacterium]
MLDAALEAQEFMKDVTQVSLAEDRKTIQAVIRSLELIGEAAAKISNECKESQPEIPWKDIIGMRNWLIHAYFDIDYDHIWNTIHKDLPVLIPKLKKLLKEVGS